MNKTGALKKMGRDDVYYSDTRASNLFGYRVGDDSMAPVFRTGDIAVVNPNLPGRPGDYVIARVGGETLLRRIEVTGRKLEALAESHLEITAPSSNILGRVVERKRLYR